MARRVVGGRQPPGTNRSRRLFGGRRAGPDAEQTAKEGRRGPKGRRRPSTPGNQSQPKACEGGAPWPEGSSAAVNPREPIAAEGLQAPCCELVNVPPCHGAARRKDGSGGGGEAVGWATARFSVGR